MQIESFTYEDCEKEPLRTIGYIQDFGALGVFNLSSQRFVSASANFASWLGIDLTQVNYPIPEDIKKRMDEFLSRQQADGKEKRILSYVNSIARPSDLAITQQGDNLVLEFQKPALAGVDRSQFDRIMRDFISLTQKSDFEHDEEWLNGIVMAYYKLTKCTRVLVYRFEQDWSGTTIAEHLIPGTGDSYMGLRFPSTDIPQIARDMFSRNSVRFIGNSQSSPVPIQSLVEGTPTPDLTDVDCRGVSQFHQIYLRNMNVSTSLSFAIFHRDRLWGLISCHAPLQQAIYVDAVTRAQGKELAGQISSALAVRNASRIMRVTDSVRGLLTDKLKTDGHDLESALRQVEAFIEEKTSTCGFAIIQDDKLYRFSKTPHPEFFESETWKLNMRVPIGQTEHALAMYRNEAASLNGCAGILHAWYVYPNSTKKIVLAFFRQELPTIVNWAGRPPQARSEPLSPSRSFALWQQKLSDHSAPWSFNDQLFARQLVTILGERFPLGA